MKRSRIFYAATIAAMVGLTAGFVLGAIPLTVSTQGGTVNEITTGAITGVTYTSTVLGTVAGPAPPASTGGPTTPQAVKAGVNAFCISATCTPGHFAETVTYTFTAAYVGTEAAMFNVTVGATAPATGGSAIVYLLGSGSAGTIVLVFDLGAGGGSVNTVGLFAQQCSTATTCP